MQRRLRLLFLGDVFFRAADHLTQRRATRRFGFAAFFFRAGDAAAGGAEAAAGAAIAGSAGARAGAAAGGGGTSTVSGGQSAGRGAGVTPAGSSGSAPNGMRILHRSHGS